MPLSAVYRKAADVLQERGWCRHYLKNDAGNMCIWGAVSFVVDGDPFKATNETRNMLTPLEQFTDGQGVIDWNNTMGRTQRQAISLLRKASKAIAA